MSNHRSALKAHRQSLKKKLFNKISVSKAMTCLKTLLLEISRNNHSESLILFSKLQSLLFKAVIKKALPRRNASRKISKVHHKIKKTFNILS